MIIRVLILWCVLIAANLAIRPLMPIDETRYVGVAWEMWVRDDFLVPHLNGETYSHKPPLLFWLMQLSWWLFSVNDWTPRVISPLFVLGSTFLSSLVARELWRDRSQVTDLTPLILLGTSFWLIFSTLTMFDMLLAFFVLLAIYSLLKLSQSNSWRNVFLLGVAIGGGVLSKGPVVLLQILPVALFAPWWIQHKTANLSWKTWYLKLGAAVLIGASLALLWAIPAGISGGEDYRNAIFLGQTSGRLVKSFAHQLPFWWYLEQLPLLLLPWLFFKPLWQGVKKLNLNDYGVRFCIAWMLPVFIMFSVVSGKRLHYLLPLIPALALLLARAADEINEIKSWRNAYFGISFLVGFIALLLGLFPVLNVIYHWQEKLNGFNPLWGVSLGIILLFVSRVNRADIKQIVLHTCILSIATPTLIAASYFEINSERFDTKPIAEKIAQFQNENQGVAFYTGKYHDQFQFTGRLPQPLTLLNSPEALQTWVLEHSDGFLLVDSEKLSPEILFYSHAYRAGQLGFIRNQTLFDHPDLIHSLQP
ncbi:MAG: glycosyltransferase family 39 protein [Methylococcales bacterium]|nr:glycosyltransferase family 39 protein [Methylococcales bacterium]MDD5753638.1 glycosyltransferase family 39 protein [Methylococcales bacterium]